MTSVFRDSSCDFVDPTSWSKDLIHEPARNRKQGSQTPIESTAPARPTGSRSKSRQLIGAQCLVGSTRAVSPAAPVRHLNDGLVRSAK